MGISLVVAMGIRSFLKFVQKKNRNTKSAIIPFKILALFILFLSGFEPLAFRLGVWRAASYIVRFIICLIV